MPPPPRGGNPLKLTPRTRQAQLSPTAALPGFGGYCPLDAPAPFGLEAVGCCLAVQRQDPRRGREDERAKRNAT